MSAGTAAMLPAMLRPVARRAAIGLRPSHTCVRAKGPGWTMESGRVLGQDDGLRRSGP
jgi:hypothetical protein